MIFIRTKLNLRFHKGKNKWHQHAYRKCKKTRRETEILQEFGESCCWGSGISSFMCLITACWENHKGLPKEISNSEKWLTKSL